MKSSEFSRKNLMNLPNTLTYLRVAAIPAILFLLTPPVTGRAYLEAFGLYVVASITDYLDGILARRRNLVTSVGKLLDPLADKLLTSAVLIMLVQLGRVSGWVVFLVLGREMTITGLRSIAASQGLILDASRMGKNKLISQTVAILFLLLYIPSLQDPLDMLGQIFLWISVFLGYWSAWDYFVDFYRKAKALEAGDAPSADV
jgi:CDP-diacylglycerol--glycerol-3-phosphate 3-phosphatidyltransferase